MNKRGFFLIIGIIFLSIPSTLSALTTGTVSPINPGHNSTQVFIPVGNNPYITLQNAIDYGFFPKANSSPITTTLLPSNSPYELASQILINVTAGGINYTMTLQDAITNNVFIIGASRSYTTTLPAGGHYGFEINVNTTNGIKTLQYAIFNNLMSSVVPSNSCPSGYICPSGNNSGNPCYPSNSYGSVQCAGIISSSGTCTNFVAQGVGCNTQNDDWHSCDGIGHCIGYVGTYGNGCSDCLFGSSGNYCILKGSWIDTPYINWQGRSAPAPAGAPYSSWSYSSLQCQYDCNCGIYGCDTCKNFIWMKP